MADLHDLESKGDVDDPLNTISQRFEDLLSSFEGVSPLSVADVLSSIQKIVNQEGVPEL